MSSGSERSSIPAKGPVRTAKTTGKSTRADSLDPARGPLTEKDDLRVKTPRIVRIELSAKSLLPILAVVAGLWLVIHGLAALLVLVTALMLVGALHPFVHWVEERKVRRLLAICAVFGASLLFVAALVAVTVPALASQIQKFIENEPNIRQSLASYLDRSHFTAAIADTLRNTRTTEFLKSVSGTLLSFGTNVLEIGAYLVAAFFLAFYMMVDRDRLRGGLYAIVPRKHHLRLSRILLNLGNIVGGYIRGQLLTCVLMSVFIFVLLIACGVPNALALAVFGGFMDLLPYIGIFLTVTPVVLVAATQGTTTAVIVFVLMLVYEEVESRVLVPLVYGRSLRLPSSVVFFSLILGTALAGIIGALLALPMAATVLMLVEELRVDLPGKTVQPTDLIQREDDHRTEKEYARRSDHLSTEEAAAVAVQIASDRKETEDAAAGR